MWGQHAGVKIKDLGLTLSVVVAVGLSAEVTQDQYCEGRVGGWRQGQRWEPGRQTHAVVTLKRRCSQDVMCAVQVMVQKHSVD